MDVRIGGWMERRTNGWVYECVAGWKGTWERWVDGGVRG